MTMDSTIHLKREKEILLAEELRLEIMLDIVRTRIHSITDELSEDQDRHRIRLSKVKVPF